MWGTSPTLGWYTRVKTHVHATVFVYRVASLTRPRIKLFMRKCGRKHLTRTFTQDVLINI